MTSTTKTKKNIKLSVVMSFYNNKEHIALAVNSILNQSYSDFEFLIIDDASTDGSYNIVKKFADKDVRIKLIKNKKNVGLTISLNKALSAAKGEYIARQDADDLSDKNRLKIQVDFLDKNQEISLVGTSAIVIDENGKKLCVRHCKTGSENIKKLFQKIKSRTNYLFHGSIMFRKEDILEIGGYREYFRYSQDYDLYFRLIESKNIDNLERPLYYWRLTRGGTSVNKHAQQMFFADLAEYFARERMNYGKDSYSKEFVENWMKNNSQEKGTSYSLNRALMLLRGKNFNISNYINTFLKHPYFIILYFYHLFKHLFYEKINNILSSGGQKRI